MKRTGEESQPSCLDQVRRIAHPTDLTEASENALVWAIRLAEFNDAELLFIHVLPPPTPIFEVEPPTKAQSEFELALMLARVRAKGVRAKALLLCGNRSISRQIVEAAQIEKSDLIVMGTAGRTAFSRLFVGSVASRVIDRARCPVLVIPKHLTEQPHCSTPDSVSPTPQLIKAWKRHIQQDRAM